MSTRAKVLSAIVAVTLIILLGALMRRCHTSGPPAEYESGIETSAPGVRVSLSIP